MQGEFFIADLSQLNADPAAHTYIRGPIEFLWRFRDQHFLDTYRRRHRHGDVPVVVMIIREYREHLLWISRLLIFLSAPFRPNRTP